MEGIDTQIAELRAERKALKERGVFWSPRLDVIDVELKRRRHEQRARTEEPPSKPWGSQETLRPAMEMPTGVARLPLRRSRAPKARYSIEPVTEDDLIATVQEIEDAVNPKEEDEAMAAEQATAVAEQLEEAKQEVTNLEEQIVQEQAAADAQQREAASVEAVRVHAAAAVEYDGLREKLVEALNAVAEISASLITLRQTLRQSVNVVTKNGGNLESVSPRFFGAGQGNERDAISRAHAAFETLAGRA